MMSESKKIKEVWKWKDGVYEKTKNMTPADRILYFNKGLKDFEKMIGIKVRKTAIKKTVTV